MHDLCERFDVTLMWKSRWLPGAIKYNTLYSYYIRIYVHKKTLPSSGRPLSTDNAGADMKVFQGKVRGGKFCTIKGVNISKIMFY